MGVKWEFHFFIEARGGGSASVTRSPRRAVAPARHVAKDGRARRACESGDGDPSVLTSGTRDHFSRHHVPRATVKLLGRAATPIGVDRIAPGYARFPLPDDVARRLCPPRVRWLARSSLHRPHGIPLP